MIVYASIYCPTLGGVPEEPRKYRTIWEAEDAFAEFVDECDRFGNVPPVMDLFDRYDNAIRHYHVSNSGAIVRSRIS